MGTVIITTGCNYYIYVKVILMFVLLSAMDSESTTLSSVDEAQPILSCGSYNFPPPHQLGTSLDIRPCRLSSLIGHSLPSSTPTSLAFSVDGERLHCGIHNSIKTFSTSRPGGAGVTRPLPRFGAVSCVTPHPSVLGVSALGSRTGGGESLFKCMASDSLVPRPIL